MVWHVEPLQLKDIAELIPETLPSMRLFGNLHNLCGVSVALVFDSEPGKATVSHLGLLCQSAGISPTSSGPSTVAAHEASTGCFQLAPLSHMRSLASKALRQQRRRSLGRGSYACFAWIKTSRLERSTSFAPSLHPAPKRPQLSDFGRPPSKARGVRRKRPRWAFNGPVPVGFRSLTD